MRRIAATIGLVGVVALFVFGLGSGGSGGTYEVRAIFDNGGFLVTGEDVRVAGASVGSVASVGVTMPGDWVNRDHSAVPGKAVVVMKIDDPGFQDFRRDASCLIRPQSLLGEKYVDCQPTQPRAPGTPPRRPLDVVPSGQPGAGQHFLPLENNGKEVDLDLVQNIMREPFADRFRLILNDLGAGLAARGPELQAIVKRADPALRETDKLLGILARQNHALAQLAANSDTVLAPLARERRHVSGFINNANTAAEATAERSSDLEAGLARFPRALHELRLEMAQLQNFSTQATPVFADFRAAAPAITRATKALGPFAHAATPALTTLGQAAKESQGPIVGSDPILRKVRDLAKTTKPGAKSLARLLVSLKTTGGYRKLMDFLYNTTGGVNGYDQYGHFLRASLKITSCTTLVTLPTLGCESTWQTSPTAKAAKPLKAPSGAGLSSKRPTGGTATPSVPRDAEGDLAGQPAVPHQVKPSRLGRVPIGAMRALLDTVIGQPQVAPSTSPSGSGDQGGDQGSSTTPTGGGQP
jgi:phospholipid/cholesterol/gamma-HCH transport system substrate-binding protein